MKTPLKTAWMGRISYEEGARLQADLLERKAGEGTHEDCLFLLEHDPVYTTGRSVPMEGGEYDALPHPVLQINRGGKVTYHGPGQLVGYPVVDLRLRGQDLHRYLRTLEEGLVLLAQRVGVDAYTREGLTGVWCGGRKLASIGVGVRRWVTMHGFAINVCGSLAGFEHIVPCGLPGVEMTSLEREGAVGVTVEVAAHLAAEVFATLL